MPVPANAVDKLIDKIKKNVGRPDDSTMDDYCIEYINDGQKKVCNKANFWFQRRSTTLAFVQSDLLKALPADFKDEDAVWILDATTSDYIELEYMEIEDYRREFDDVTESQPTHYMLDGEGNIIIRPVPDDSYTIKLDYFCFLADLTAGGASNDLLDNYPEILESWGTHKALMRLREFDDAAAWKSQFQGELQDLVLANAQRELPDEFVLRPRSDVRGTGIRVPKGRLG